LPRGMDIYRMKISRTGWRMISTGEPTTSF